MAQANKVALVIKDECTSDHMELLQLAICEEKLRMMVGCLFGLSDVLADVRVNL